MKISIFGKALAADFAFRFGKKYMEKRREHQERERAHAEAQAEAAKYKYSLGDYTKTEAIALISLIFDHPRFQAAWQIHREEANNWVLHMDPREFYHTFGVAKPMPASYGSRR